MKYFSEMSGWFPKYSTDAKDQFDMRFEWGHTIFFLQNEAISSQNLQADDRSSIFKCPFKEPDTSQTKTKF